MLTQQYHHKDNARLKSHSIFNVYSNGSFRFWLVEPQSQEEDNVGRYDIIPNAWLILEQECWFPKAKNRKVIAQLAKEGLPPLKKSTFKKIKVDILVGNGKHDNAFDYAM